MKMRWACGRNRIRRGQRAQMSTLYRETLTALEEVKKRVKAEAKKKATVSANLAETVQKMTYERKGKTVTAAVPDPRINTDREQAKLEGTTETTVRRSRHRAEKIEPAVMKTLIESKLDTGVAQIEDCDRPIENTDGL